MRNNDPYKTVDVNNESEGDIAYCKTCEEVGRRSKLWEDEKDPENFCICDLGHKHPIYTREIEGKWSYPFPHVDNPFESGFQSESIGKRKMPDRLKQYRDTDEDDN